MLELAGQTGSNWQETLRRAIALQPETLSTYCLILEEDTEFWRLFQAGHIKPNEEQELRMYELAIETLATAGYRQYEISNLRSQAGSVRTTSRIGRKGLPRDRSDVRVRRS